MRELSLFSGSGGGLLGSKLLGWKCVGYVENNPYCQKILKQRIADGILDAAPIFGDIRRFLDDGFAEAYQGMVDVITGGFPCQDISIAGNGEGIEGERSRLWKEMSEIIGKVRPRFVFVENSPMLTLRGGTRVIADLTAMWYDCEWGVVGADDVGANHRRKRMWILAYTDGFSARASHEPQVQRNVDSVSHDRDEVRDDAGNGGSPLADADVRGCLHGQAEIGPAKAGLDALGESESGGEPLSDSDVEGLQGSEWGGVRGEGRAAQPSGCPQSGRGHWSTEPGLGRVVNGMAHRVDRIKAIGNGQVPLAMAYAYAILSRRIAL